MISEESLNRMCAGVIEINLPAACQAIIQYRRAFLLSSYAISIRFMWKYGETKTNHEQAVIIMFKAIF